MYCIDTSALLHGWKRDYPPDIFKSLWDNLTELGQSNNLISPDEVLLELKRGDDDLCAWMEEREYIFIEPDEEAQKVVAEIVNRFPDFVPEESHDGVWADPYVIAVAKVKNATVVTGEKAVGPGAKRPKIPNICQELGIECITLLELIRREGWTF
ncbi:DUF4411 family protein [Thermincola potens]|uniref:DUF4411 family protein n=1 Tax=Thermincola potens (strain JR) TaxID=635013 RepID=D5XE69_THEPJ|nr:DUF4411 family protein [Thermincola potens]ADG81940.1 conserved hypothetical protein [Thermincola potens JR]